MLVYKALIRSVIDYGSIAYDSAPQSQLARLDSIQCQALRICTGAMRGTSLAVMQAHCDEMPLQLRRLKYQTQYSVKVGCSVGHISEKIFEDHWTHHYGRFTDRNQPVAIKVSGFQQERYKLEVHAPKLGNLPPWLVVPPRTNDELTNEISKHEQPEALLAISNCLIDSYSDHARVYTDASKTTDGKVGIGCFFEACQDNPERKFACRVTDRITVYAGEMAAIRLAIQESAQLNGNMPVAVFSDSLSAIRSIESERSNSRPNMLRDILDTKHALQREVTLVWVPSHVGIQGNETADRLANEGTKKSAVDIDIGIELAEAYSTVDDYCRSKWQEMWSLRTNDQFSLIVPSVLTTRLQQQHFASRRIEVTANRLRFGRCRLNAYLHVIGRHDTGLCAQCGVPETVKHYVMECDNNVTREVKAFCQFRKQEHTLASVLSNGEIIRLICRVGDRTI